MAETVEQLLKTILGEPKKGVHKYRIGNIAIVDVIGTLIAAFIISYFFQYTWWKVVLILFLLGIVMHRIFNVNTTVDIWLRSL